MESRLRSRPDHDQLLAKIAPAQARAIMPTDWPWLTSSGLIRILMNLLSHCSLNPRRLQLRVWLLVLLNTITSCTTPGPRGRPFAAGRISQKIDLIIICTQSLTPFECVTITAQPSVPARDRFPFRRFGTGPSRRSPHIGGLLGLLAA